MQPNATIRDTLIASVANDRDPVDVYNNAPPHLQAHWGSSANVPPYLWMSLREILLGATATAGDLDAAVIDSYGLGDTPSGASIQIVSLPVESVADSESPQADPVGAEFARLRIISQLHPDVEDVDANKIEQTDLKIRFLIDHLWRQERAKFERKLAPLSPTIKPALTVTDYILVADPRVGPFTCHWQGWLVNENAIAKASLYHVHYYRAIV